MPCKPATRDHRDFRWRRARFSWSDMAGAPTPTVLKDVESPKEELEDGPVRGASACLGLTPCGCPTPRQLRLSALSGWHSARIGCPPEFQFLAILRGRRRSPFGFLWLPQFRRDLGLEVFYGLPYFLLVYSAILAAAFLRTTTATSAWTLLEVERSRRCVARSWDPLYWLVGNWTSTVTSAKVRGRQQAGVVGFLADPRGPSSIPPPGNSA